LWGELYFQPAKRTFEKKNTHGDETYSFVQFVLEPLYKIFSQIIGEETQGIDRVVGEFGFYHRHEFLSLDVEPLLKEVFSWVLGSAIGLINMIVKHLPSTKAGANAKVCNTYSGPLKGDLVHHMITCNGQGPFVANVVKLFPKTISAKFECLSRILSGRVQPGDKVRVLGESYSPDDEEDSLVQLVTSVQILQTRYCVPLSYAVAGNIVLLGGIDTIVVKTATVVSGKLDDECYIFKPLQFSNVSVMKIATEPLNPADLPKMVVGLRKINKTYPLAITKVEESGEHTIFGTGELYIDCLMKDLRDMFADVEVKVADPVVSFL
jgi:U5 small nuclear ribonucleoprotein component